MSRFCGERQAAEILAAGEHWRDTALLGERSVLTEESVWNTANIETLEDVFTQNPDETDRRFVERPCQQGDNYAAGHVSAFPN